MDIERGGGAEHSNDNGQNVRTTRPTVVSSNKMPEESKKAKRTIFINLLHRLESIGDTSSIKLKVFPVEQRSQKVLKSKVWQKYSVPQSLEDHSSVKVSILVNERMS